MSPREVCWRFIVQTEGNGTLTYDPDDPGGVTNWGFAQRHNPDIDVRSLDEPRAKARFVERYWIPLHGDELPAPIAVALGDGAFNQGVWRAVSQLQGSLHVEVDGIMGPHTIEAALSAVPRELVNDMLSRRLVHYCSGQEKYRRGWAKRVLELKDVIAEL